ncbi:MAG: tRNA (guanosine(37)-N1)-methyltransferase TrmD [Micromonosporaceae bacterium]
MRIEIITIFPGYFAPLEMSLIGKAVLRGDIHITVHDLRDWAHDVHRTVDDTPYGGGPGMVMKPEPWGEALDAVAAAAGPVPRLIVPTPSGALFTQRTAASYASQPRLVFACGRYEGIDARVIEEARTHMPVDEVSIGDYVLAGGEAAALVMVEAVCRLLPGVLGNVASVADDSFGGSGNAAPADVGPGEPAAWAPGGRAAPPPGGGGGNVGQGGMTGLLEGPVYTKPRVWRGREVPPVLLSGDHGAIARWRRDAALLRTAQMRPELIGRLDPGALDDRDREVLSDAGCPVRAKDMAH